ncbi:MAG: bifunctional phosphopantothenoylcysteine decarboxylase/phosphopantothenate--cysteine ligase CoaBC [Rhodothermales bacterium]
MTLNGTKIILGVCGGIAAYKAALLVRLLKKAGAEVQVLMTPDAARFITPLTLGTLSEREVLVEIFPSNEDGSWTKHVHLGLWADLFVVVPATAHTLAKLAHGFCDTMITAVALSARCPLMVCPAMDHDMYIHPATQANLQTLRAHGAHVMEAAHGELASGLVGQGRLPEPEAIVACMAEQLTEVPQTLAGKHVLVSAGPTREPIDPVRFISNHSTGTMGYAMAAAAKARGARVTLISGPTTLTPPPGVKVEAVTTAAEMHAAVLSHADADWVIMAAAVADYTPADPADHKVKKSNANLALPLRRTTDILADLGRQKREGQVLVGFAMETDDALANAQVKLQKKHLDWIVLNNLRETGAGFGTTTNRVTLLRHDGYHEDLPLLPKAQVAAALLDRMTTSN